MSSAKTAKTRSIFQPFYHCHFRCIYRFEGQRGERVRIVVNRMMAGNRSCETKMDTDIDRSFCFGDNTAKVEILERPWHESVVFSRSCVCNSSSNSSSLPVIYTSTGREIEVHFSAINMSNFDDPDSLNFEATFEFFKGPQICKDVRKKTGSHGVVTLSGGEVSGTGFFFRLRVMQYLLFISGGMSQSTLARGTFARQIRVHSFQRLIPEPLQSPNPTAAQHEHQT